jgi:hypothetical protein
MVFFYEVLLAAILLPIESFLAAHMTDTVCRYMNFWERRWVTTDDLFFFVLMLVPFALVAWAKEKIGMHFVVIVVSSLLLIMSVCLNVWGLAHPA